MSWRGYDDFLQRVTGRLSQTGPGSQLPEGGDMDIWQPDSDVTYRRAAVLIGIQPGLDGAKVLFTLRPETLRVHPGQVAFPGGKVDASDHDEIAAALREAQEEIGLPPDKVDIIGCAAPYMTGTAFRITPVLATLPADFSPQPDPHEVDAVFNVPLNILMNPDNHILHQKTWQGRPRRYYEIPHAEYRIWGVTAGIVKNLYTSLYDRQYGDMKVEG